MAADRPSTATDQDPSADHAAPGSADSDRSPPGADDRDRLSPTDERPQSTAELLPPTPDRERTGSADADSRDRDALRRENSRLRSRVEALERTLDEHERRRQAIVDQYELVLDRRDGRHDPDGRADGSAMDGRTDGRDSGPERGSVGRSTGPLALVRRTLASPFD